MNPFFLRALLAALPVLGLTTDGENGIVIGGIGMAVLLLATFIFLLVRRFIPEMMRQISLLLLLAFLGIFAHEIVWDSKPTFPFLHSVSPSSILFLWVSLLVLMLPDPLHPEKRWGRIFRKTAGVGLIFWALIAAHGMLSELLGPRTGIFLFGTAAGSYFLVALLLPLIPRLEKFRR